MVMLIREREVAAAAAAVEAVSTTKVRATKRAALKKITVGAKPDVLDAHDSVITAGQESGGKVVSPSLAAARSRRLLDRSAWSGSAGKSSLSSRPDASADRRSSHENTAHTNGRKPYDRAPAKFAAAAVSTAKIRATAKVNATKQLESAALKSPGLAAALQRTAEGRAWDRKAAADTKPDVVATDAATGEVKKPVYPSLAAARTRGLPSRTAWSGGNVDRVGSTSLTASDAFAATRSSKDIGTRVGERNHQGAHGTAARGKPAVVIASDEAMPAEKIVSPSLAAARMRGMSVRSALVFNDISGTSFSSASENSHSRKSSFDSGGHGWDSRKSSYDSGGRARGVARKEPPVNAAPLKITVGAKPDVLDAHDSVLTAGEKSGGKVVSPSLAAARSRRLLDRSAWSGSAGESSISSRPDASADRRSSQRRVVVDAFLIVVAFSVRGAAEPVRGDEDVQQVQHVRRQRHQLGVALGVGGFLLNIIMLTLYGGHRGTNPTESHVECLCCS